MAASRAGIVRCILAAVVTIGCAVPAQGRQSSVAVAPEMVVRGTPDEAKSCTELYSEFRRLYQHTYAQQNSFWDNPLNTVAAAVGTVFPPAYLVWGYSAYEDVVGERKAASAQARMAALSDVSARKQCFVR